MASVNVTNYQQAYLQRQAALKEWDTQFHKEKPAIVNAIAASMFKELTDKLEESFKPEYALYTEKRPAAVSCTLQNRHCSASVKKLLAEGTLLHKLLVPKAEATPKAGLEIEKGGKVLSGIYSYEEREEFSALNPNDEIINEMLSEVGIAVAEVLTDKLQARSTERGCSSLRSRVDWIAGEKGWASKGTSYNAVRATAWHVFDEPNKAPKERSSGLFGM